MLEGNVKEVETKVVADKGGQGLEIEIERGLDLVKGKGPDRLRGGDQDLETDINLQLGGEDRDLKIIPERRRTEQKDLNRGTIVRVAKGRQKGNHDDHSHCLLQD